MASGLQEFADLFGAASTGAENLTTGVQRVTDKTVELETKLSDTIDQAKEGAVAYAGVTALAQLGSFFALLYIAGRLSKRGAE